MRFTIVPFLFLLITAASAQNSTLNRPKDPVILTGTDLSNIIGSNPARVVGFAWVNNAWVQIPVQVDERAQLDIVTPYGPLAAQNGYPPSSSNLKIYFYCDPSTYTGADPDATLDMDDEVVFMVKDAGGLFPGGNYPAGILPGSCRQVQITDPQGGLGYVYIFLSNGSLTQNAGVNYVSYSFSSLGTGFPANNSGVNAENSTVTTPAYSWHFSSEWVSDVLKLATGTNADILDRHKNFFANGVCTRHEDAFSGGENAYVTNKSGPIRIIRSYMGAMSGPLTQRTHLFYQQRHDILTDLRVHSIASIYDAFDYAPAAGGMTYANNANTGGVLINGSPDAVTPADINWEMVTGSQGSMVILHRRTTTLTASEANFTSYYDDNSANPASNCTGDGQAWGTSGTGVQFLSASVCTDPVAAACGISSGGYRTLQSRRVIYVEQPNISTALASSYNNQLYTPLQLGFQSCQAATNVFVISVAANPAPWGTVTGSGSYLSGQTVTATATPATGYQFTGWTENGTPVSSSATYTFTAAANRNLIAQFSPVTAIAGVSTDTSPVLFPNPAKKQAFLTRLVPGRHYELTVLNAAGQVVLQQNISSAKPGFRLQQPGMYTVVLKDSRSQHMYKLVVIE